MKIKLIFDDWQDPEGRNACYSELSRGDFHSGTTFNGEIFLDSEQASELKEALARGFNPVFWITEK